MAEKMAGIDDCSLGQIATGVKAMTANHRGRAKIRTVQLEDAPALLALLNERL